MLCDTLCSFARRKEVKSFEDNRQSRETRVSWLSETFYSARQHWGFICNWGCSLRRKPVGCVEAPCSRVWCLGAGTDSIVLAKSGTDRIHQAGPNREETGASGLGCRKDEPKRQDLSHSMTEPQS